MVGFQGPSGTTSVGPPGGARPDEDIGQRRQKTRSRFVTSGSYPVSKVALMPYFL